MGKPPVLLSHNEVVVRHMRTHMKTLIPNIIIVIVLLLLAGFMSWLCPSEWSPYSHIVIWSIVAVVSLPLLLVPYLRWVTTTYTLTSRRVVTRHGILTKRGHDLPLSRISDISQERSLLDRFFGCGSLILQTSSDDPLLLSDIPDVDLVQGELSNLLFDEVQEAIDLDPRQ